MLYKTKPQGKKWLEVAACFIEYDGKILLLKRPKTHKFANTWIEPGGKIDLGETPEEAMIREVYEESGVKIEPGKAQELGKLYFHFDDTDIAITFFHYTFKEIPIIQLAPKEAQEYKWSTINEALKLNLIDDLDEILNIFFIQK